MNFIYNTQYIHIRTNMPNIEATVQETISYVSFQQQQQIT